MGTNQTSFKPGRSGNPVGKKPGTKDKRTALRALLAPHCKGRNARSQEAAALMQALSAQARVVEAEELLKRVEALEQTLNRGINGPAYRTHHPA